MKTVIVTGASRGIGAAICRNLRAKGIRVIGVARTEDALRQLAMEKIGPGPMEYMVGNVIDSKVAKETVELAIKGGNSLDGLILNAGTIHPVSKLAEAQGEKLQEAFQVNCFSTLAWIQAALPALRSSGGRLIYTTSGASDLGLGGFGAYGASKAAMNSLITTLATEEPTIVCLAISPGPVETSMFNEFFQLGKGTLSEEQTEYFGKLRREGNYSQPEVVAEGFAKVILFAPKGKSGTSANWDDSWIAQLD